jgi:hypothetical protein
LKPKTVTAIRDRYPLLLFLSGYFLFILLTWADYGMTFDESGVYARGIGLAHYLVHDDYAGFTHKSVSDDGLVVYNHLYGMVLSLFNPAGEVDCYHFLNLLFASLLFIAIFEVLFWRYEKPWLAVLGPVFLFFSPRFLGDIPGNPKDMPFAVFYFLALTAIYYFHRRPAKNPLVPGLILGLFFGLAQSSRMMAFTLYLIFLLFNLHFFYRQKPKPGLREWKQHLRQTAGLLLMILILSNFIMVLTWPYLGSNYFKHLYELLTMSGDFFWQNNVLFLGREILSTQLPWYYLPVWFLIGLPLFLLFFIGYSLTGLRKKWKDPLFILMLSAMAVILGGYFLARPVIYDGLRHFLFLIPILVVLAAAGAIEFCLGFKRPLLKKIIIGLASLNLLAVTYHMVRIHPYEYLYFNELTCGLKGSEGKFDNDYWGASFRETVEWLKSNEIKDQKRIYKIHGSGNPYQIFYYFTGNMKWVDNIKDADYYLSTTRDKKHLLAGSAPVIHVAEREGVPLNYVFKMK